MQKNKEFTAYICAHTESANPKHEHVTANAGRACLCAAGALLGCNHKCGTSRCVDRKLQELQGYNRCLTQAGFWLQGKQNQICHSLPVSPTFHAAEARLSEQKSHNNSNHSTTHTRTHARTHSRTHTYTHLRARRRARLRSRKRGPAAAGWLLRALGSARDVCSMRMMICVRIPGSIQRHTTDRQRQGGC
eukprot:524879-Pelagomonas_calceolata.AAC.4